MSCPITGCGMGYARHREDFAALESRQRAFSLDLFGDAPLPPSIDLTDGKIPVKNQGSVGACTGFSRAVGEEILNLMATGKYTELSPQFAYIENQKACGMLGADNGATIDGSVQAAGSTGICTESACPWPGRYLPSVPASAETEGRLHLISGHAVMRSADDIFAWLGHRQGPVLIGITWTEGLSQSTGEITAVTGRPIGGHALVLTGYEAGCVRMRNSWGTRWGRNGDAMVSRAVIDQWIASGEALIGISDLAAWGPRQLNSWSGVA